MRIKLLVLFSLLLVVLLAGCVKVEKPTQIQYKNDAITVENLQVDNLAPYAGGVVTMELDIQNNGDTKRDVVIDFFDIPGFTVSDLSCNEPFGKKEGNKCLFQNENAIESLDTRHIKLTIRAPENVMSPTSYTISFSVKYPSKFDSYREAIIPIIDSDIKKEPSFKFSQSEPTIDPIVFDIVPDLEREKIVGKTTVKEYWGVVGRVFSVKFEGRHIGTVKGVKPATIEKSWVQIESLTNLKVAENYYCDFKDELGGLNTPLLSQKRIIQFDNKFPLLICNFEPVGSGLEFAAKIKLLYAYAYEFINTQTLVVQPRVGFA